MLINKPEHL